MNITFIGGGNMATAMIGGLLQKGWSADAIRVVEIDAATRARLDRDLHVGAAAGLDPATAAVECIVLAVKPQQMRAVAQALRPWLGSQLIVSIAAGVRVGDLSRWLGGYSRIVRVMPNTAALTLASISGLCAPPAVSPEDRARVAEIMGAVGATLWLQREEQMDAITAISGSGPAYVFYFIEALQQAAADLGFEAGSARRLALETFAGAVRLAQATGEDPATLRARVTSKGGTTECALGIMDAARVKEVIVRAARAAADRSRELGEEFGKDA